MYKKSYIITYSIYISLYIYLLNKFIESLLKTLIMGRIESSKNHIGKVSTQQTKTFV